MKSYPVEKVSHCLDTIIEKLLKTIPFSSKIGLLNGKTGNAILLYHYAHYKKNPSINEYADHLIDDILQNLTMDIEIGFDEGVAGLVWGINYLMRSGFVSPGENDVFENLDSMIWRQPEFIVNIDDFEEFSGMGLYILSRMNSSQQESLPLWEQQMNKYLQKMYTIIILRYTCYPFPLYPCKDLLSLVYVCNALHDHKQFNPIIEAIYSELPYILEISFLEEDIFADRYMLEKLLEEMQLYATTIFSTGLQTNITLTDINRFYTTRLLLNKQVNTPDIINKAILTTVNDSKHINELLLLMNPDNIGLGNYVSGLAWSLLQWIIEHENKNPKQPDK